VSLAPGTRLEHYEILSPLGKGGMGEVYRARDTKLGREVAIKTLPAGLSGGEHLARFKREALSDLLVRRTSSGRVLVNRRMGPPSSHAINVVTDWRRAPSQI
jgi:serine/threonine protein kinase